MARAKGLPKTGGRKKGTRNKRTEALEIIAVDPALATLPPLEFLLSIPLANRIDAAAKAAQYVHPKLMAADPSAKPNNPYAGKSTQELNAIFMAELAKRGYMLVKIPKEPQEATDIANPPIDEGNLLRRRWASKTR